MERFHGLLGIQEAQSRNVYFFASSPPNFAEFLVPTLFFITAPDKSNAKEIKIRTD